MYYEIYIDQFFLEQFLSGFLLLSVAGRLSRASPSPARLVFASLAGAACMSVSVCLGRLKLYPLGFFAAAGCAFWRRPLRKKWQENLQAVLCLLAVTVFFGGAVEALTALLPLPLLAALFAAYALVSVLSGYVREKFRETENRASVCICLKSRSLVLEGLLDTGNFLTEPITGHPVSIADEKALASLLDTDWEERQGFCLIPYHSLGMDNGWLRGVTFDEMTVTMRRGSRTIRRPMIALYEENVSAGNRYQIIVHPEHAP
ncbi:MAG: sigma-E processing peptidase SpoIIGA [Lachnospiraceae bacterium]|nr:sigma-E processing peptidase SpoIIGA [Lachnospiraceae bacterium]